MGIYEEVNDKQVLLSRPYEASAIDIIGREREIEKIRISWMSGPGRIPKAPLLIGEPGTGKNEVVYACARGYSKPLFTCQGNEDVRAEDLSATLRVSDDPDKNMDYIFKPLATAMLKGWIFFLDGIFKMRERALAPLESVLDRRRYIDSDIFGDRIDAHPGFRFIAATNPSDMLGSHPPDWLKSRLKPVIRFDYPDRKVIDRILKVHYPVLRKNGTPAIKWFWDLWKDKNSDKPLIPRDCIDIFGWAQNAADHEAVKHIRPFALEMNGHGSEIKRKHMVNAFEVYAMKHEGSDHAT